MLACVAKMETCREDDWAAFASFFAGPEGDVEAGKLDYRGPPVVLNCFRVWTHDYRVSFGAQRGRARRQRSRPTPGGEGRVSI